MAIRTVVTGGFGNGTFNGTIPLVVLRGYVAAAAVVVDPASNNTWPTSEDGFGRTWTPEADGRTWNPDDESRFVWNTVDKTRNL